MSETPLPRTGPHRPSLDEVRREGQPEHIRTRANAEHWSADLWWRHLSPYVSVAAIRIGMSANAVSVVMIVCGWLAAAVLLTGTWWGALLAVILAHTQMLLDASDGEVARWRRTTSPRGVFLDRIAHTTTESLMPACFGIGWGLVHDSLWQGAAAGFAIAMFVLINKSINDGVTVSRAAAGLPKLPDVAGAKTMTPGVLARARRIANVVPLHRMYHSVEQAHLYAVASIVAVWWPASTGALLIALLVATPLVIVGHIAAVLASSRLTSA